MKTIAEQLACTRRELDMRRRVYPQWVRDGRMSRDAADREVATMASIVDTLQKLQYLAEISDEMKASYTSANDPR